ncbi:TetR/AcrR family transcriptional regulator [Demequina litorisediminis]|uniref:TetR family transcriptional regulator n=1 Tax=Demequina litorisediminis TaxID=1849022 RepID=A0ABQ6IBX1_9MICO|nr:TetR/AcrR family transcriptional regulator [Demequina litorisediminis]GMA35322.1 TetR family transcriptional regulator [Demequina litorisediminis]
MAIRLAPAERRARILDTAMAITDAEGHRGLTMAALARRCDMSTPGVLHYFPDMPTLLVALVQRRDERDDAGLDWEAMTPERVRLLLDATVANIVARPRAAALFAAVEAEALDPTHPGHDYFRERADRLASGLASMLSGPDAEGVARRLFAAMDGLQLHYLRDPEGFDLVAQWAATADALLGECR